MENKELTMAEVFRPEDTVIELGEHKVRLVFDMLAFCELEKEYGSVDTVLDMLFGGVATRLEPIVTYNDAPVNTDEIKVDGTPLNIFLVDKDKEKRKAKHSDTLNLVWAGMLHDNAIMDEECRIIGYKIPKRDIMKEITFKNYASLNISIVQSVLKDLAPNIGSRGESKNEPTQEPETTPEPIQLVKAE